jgi:hypothetical protein
MPDTNQMITLVEIVHLRGVLRHLGGDPAELADELENAKFDGTGTLSYADTRAELGICPTTDHHWANECTRYTH